MLFFWHAGCTVGGPNPVDTQWQIGIERREQSSSRGSRSKRTPQPPPPVLQRCHSPPRLQRHASVLTQARLNWRTGVHDRQIHRRTLPAKQASGRKVRLFDYRDAAQARQRSPTLYETQTSAKSPSPTAVLTQLVTAILAWDAPPADGQKIRPLVVSGSQGSAASA